MAERHRLPAFDYWQYWRNGDDADVGRFCAVHRASLAEIGGSRHCGRGLNEAKKVLANEATRLRRGSRRRREA